MEDGSGKMLRPENLELAGVGFVGFLRGRPNGGFSGGRLCWFLGWCVFFGLGDLVCAMELKGAFFFRVYNFITYVYLCELMFDMFHVSSLLVWFQDS